MSRLWSSLARVFRRMRGIRERMILQPEDYFPGFCDESEFAVFYTWWYGYWRLEIFPDGRVVFAMEESSDDVDWGWQHWEHQYHFVLRPQQLASLRESEALIECQSLEPRYEHGGDDFPLATIRIKNAQRSWQTDIEMPFCFHDDEKLAAVEPLLDLLMACKPI